MSLDRRVLEEISRSLIEFEKRIERLETIEGLGGWVLIDDQLLTVDTANFDFTSIPNYYKHLRIIGYIRSNVVETYDATLLRLNNDSGNNYDFISLRISHSAVLGTEEGLATSYILVSRPAGSTAPANVFDHLSILIPHYANTLNNKTLRSWGGLKTGTSTGNISFRDSVGWWRSNSAINRITIYPSVGTDWLSGSRMSLYGVR